MKWRAWALTVIAVAALAACGDDDGTGDRYSPEIRNAYLEGCGGSQNAEFCECTLTELEKRFTQEEFIAFAIEASEEPPEEFVEITLACLSEVDVGG
ncbi:MAG TPA: hypothetical protein VFY15_05615 [Acidimicrobiia bacterium]|nr:hypothetical protein [Acidimicrobiia bacterium]